MTKTQVLKTCVFAFYDAGKRGFVSISIAAGKWAENYPLFYFLTDSVIFQKVSTSEHCLNFLNAKCPLHFSTKFRRSFYN
jgi:hypothetical protein